jgi:hypothetical protein
MQSRILKKEADKQSLLRRLSAEQCRLMIFYEDVPPDHIPHEKAGECVFLLHPPYNYKVLEQWLYLGNWQAIFPANKNYQSFDTFRTEDFEIERKMRTANIALIIDSFHDDIEWKLSEIA